MREGPRRYSAHIGYLFTEMPFRERIAAAARWGFSAIEHPAPYAYPAADIARWLAEEGLSYSQFGSPSGDAAKGEKGIAIFPERVSEFRAGIHIGLDYAETIGASMVHAMAGVVPPGSPQEHGALRDTYIANLRFAAQAAAARGKVILVEPMSPAAVPGYFVATPDVATEAIVAAGEPNIKLLLDVFHTAATGDDHRAVIARYTGLIGHVHLSDYPGRHEPGSGNIDFAGLYEALDAADYQGFYGCEYSPATTTETGLHWLASHRQQP